MQRGMIACHLRKYKKSPRSETMPDYADTFEKSPSGFDRLGVISVSFLIAGICAHFLQFFLPFVHHLIRAFEHIPKLGIIRCE